VSAAIATAAARQARPANVESRAMTLIAVSVMASVLLVAPICFRYAPCRRPPGRHRRRSNFSAFQFPKTDHGRSRNRFQQRSGPTRTSASPPKPRQSGFNSCLPRHLHITFYWNATSARLLSFRECSRSRSCAFSFSSALRPISRCCPTRLR
jgi:hypothetical protein